MFHVGQMVVCVDDNWFDASEPLNYPVKGLVYTIREIEPFERQPGGVCLRFEEIVNPIKDYREGFLEARFIGFRFRPVRQTSIEQFTAILNQAPQREDA